MTQALAGRHALVTGGGRGIGAAIAAALAGAGARVTLLGRTTAELEATVATLPGGALAVTADVTDAGQVERAFAKARAAAGEVEILVNNAGVAKSRPLAKTDEAFWRSILEVNLTGAFHCTHAALAGNARRQPGPHRLGREHGGAARAMPTARPTVRRSTAWSASRARLRSRSRRPASPSTRSAPDTRIPASCATRSAPSARRRRAARPMRASPSSAPIPSNGWCSRRRSPTPCSGCAARAAKA